MLATAESCTGGLVSACLTEIAGSSDVFDRGFVTYSNDAKMELLGVPRGLLETVGAVSAEVAEVMAAGAIEASRADVALSVTGIAGPGGGSPAKPVGLVFIGSCRRGATPASARHLFPGDRSAVRQATLAAALARLAELAPARAPRAPAART
jgi:nicotinamide-nucleotide amidase